MNPTTLTPSELVPPLRWWLRLPFGFSVLVEHLKYPIRKTLQWRSGPPVFVDCLEYPVQKTHQLNFLLRMDVGTLLAFCQNAHHHPNIFLYVRRIEGGWHYLIKKCHHQMYYLKQMYMIENVCLRYMIYCLGYHKFYFNDMYR